MLIRPANDADRDAIADVIEPVIAEGETYALDRDMGRDAALGYWLGADHQAFVAEEGGRIVGTYFIRPNQAGGGRHVCNCGYVTAPDSTGRGVARQMHAHSLQIAKARGYRAMQFNFVISSNERAVRLWRSLGFEIVGRLPLAFESPTHGFVDALVMHRAL